MFQKSVGSNEIAFHVVFLENKMVDSWKFRKSQTLKNKVLRIDKSETYMYLFLYMCVLLFLYVFIIYIFHILLSVTQPNHLFTYHFLSYLYMNIFEHIFIYVDTYIYIYVCVYVYTYTCISIHVCIDT